MSKLYFRYGAIGSGKSTALLQIAHNYNEKNMQVILIKPNVDTKGEKNVESGVGISRMVDVWIPKKVKFKKILDLTNISAIIVDEAHFLSANQVDELYEISKLNDIPVFCYGLRCDFKMQGFPGSQRLLELADSIEELKSICRCGGKATQSLRMKNGIPIFEGEQVLIDGELDGITYDSVCGKCFLELREKYSPKTE